MPTKYIRASGGAWGDAATWSLSSGGPADTTVPTAADDVVMDSNSGNAVGNLALCQCKTFTQTGTPGILTINAGCRLAPYGDVVFLAGKVVFASDGAGLYSLGTLSLTSAGCLLGHIRIDSPITLNDDISFLASKNCYIYMDKTNAFNLNGKTVSGNSATNRLIIWSNPIGTPRTITVNGGTFANCDFRDIAFDNGGADLDLSAITGLSGNCGGNSMSGGGVLTFSPVRTYTFASTGGNWSDASKWTTDIGTNEVPLVQGRARTQPMSAGQTITVDMPRLPDTSFAGCGSTNLPSVALTTTGLTYEVYGSYNLTGAGTYTRDKALSYLSRSNASVTNNGKSATAATTIAMPGATLTMNDAFTSSSSVSLTNGTLNSAYSFTCTTFASSAGTTLTRTGSPLWTLTGSGAVWNVAGTVTTGLATIALTYTGATACTFAGGTNTYNDIQIAPGSGVLTFSGAFTFRNMTMSSAGTRSIVFTKGTTYTMTGDSFLSGANGSIDNVTINSTFDSDISGWTIGGNIISAEFADGAAHVHFNGVINSTGSNWFSPTITLQDNTLYKITFDAKFISGSVLQAGLSYAAYKTISGEENGGAWASYEYYAVSSTSGRVTFASMNGVWDIDNVFITKMTNYVLIQSGTEGEPFTLSKASGLIASNYLAIKDCIATGGATWLAGYESTNISGNTGWHFNSPASGAGVIDFVGNATAKALCRGIPAAAEIVFTATATAKALCRAAGSGVIEFVGSCSSLVAAWKTTGLFKATERYIGQYFKASKRRN